jgi:hypothetical protein
MLRQYVACNFPTERRPLPRDRVTCPHRQFLVLVDRQPAGERDPFRVSQQAAIAVGHEQAAAQRSSDTKGLPAQPSVKADIDHKERFPAVTNPAAVGAIAGGPVSGALAPTPATPGRCSSREADRCRKAPEATQMKRPPNYHPTREIVSIEKGKITKEGGAFHARQ